MKQRAGRERESEVEVQNVARLELVGKVEKIKVDRWRACDKRNKGDGKHRKPTGRFKEVRN